MNTTQQYYNARPSMIGNIGQDMLGAKRMAFDTYETSEERERALKAKQASKGAKEIKAKIKAEVLSITPDVARVIYLIKCQFGIETGGCFETYDSCLMSMRADALDQQRLIPEYNKLVRKYNATNRTIRRLLRNPKYYLGKMRAKYAPKHSYVEQNGKTASWKDVSQSEARIGDLAFLSAHSRAVQFGNSVSDKERAYIVAELSEFLSAWAQTDTLREATLDDLAWCFGARGNNKSVAYYNPTSKLISVNRNNIGSLIHEIGHYLDHQSGWGSSRISYATREDYRQQIDGLVRQDDLRYFLDRKEIFARAFEAYCLESQAGFSEFAQYSKAWLPKLNQELRQLITNALTRQGKK